jgi:predicted AAA+ superfamily ATPase
MAKLAEKIIIEAKEEKKELLSRRYVDREGLTEFRNSLKSGLVNIVAGPRRAGKSVFSMLGLKEEDFAYLNFDDDRIRQISNTDDILEGIISFIEKCSIFIKYRFSF